MPGHEVGIFTYEIWIQIIKLKIFLGVQWLSICLPVYGGWVQPLVRELKSHMPQGQKKNQNIKWSNIVTKSIKTLKKVHIKNIFCKFLYLICRHLFCGEQRGKSDHWVTNIPSYCFHTFPCLGVNFGGAQFLKVSQHKSQITECIIGDI